METILVTGASGFIGQYVVEALLRKGHAVIASSAHPENAMRASWYGRVEYIPLDLQALDLEQDYYTILGRPARMLHLAWEGLPNYKANFHVESNYPRHAAFLKNMVDHGLEDLTVVGTCFEYGFQEGCLREDMAALPANPYGRGKDLLRQFLEKLAGRQPFVFRWVRLFYMYGKGQAPNSLFSQLDRAILAGDAVFNMSGGEQVRDFLPVEEVAEYLAAIVLQRRVTGIINCCSGQPVTVRSLVEKYLSDHHVSILLNLGYYPYPDYEPMRFWGDDTKLKSILNNE